MNKYLEIALVLLMVLLIAAVILLSGCVSGDQPSQYARQPSDYGAAQQNRTGQAFSGRAPWQGNRTGQQFQNLTPEQRQQMQQQRLSLAISACEGKTAGAACEFSIRAGAPNISGSCTAQNSTLACVPARGNRLPGGNRSFQQPQQ